MTKKNYQMTNRYHIRKVFLSVLTIFFMVNTLLVRGQGCDAQFFGTNPTNFAVSFYNISYGSPNSAAWDFGDGNTASALNGVTHTYAAAGTYNVCLSIADLSGCASTICQNVTIDALGNYLDSTCYYTDCVFAGDANRDDIVNVYDFLPIALHNGTLGVARPNASTAFVGQAAADWQGSLPSGANLKHTDANGDGTISLVDAAVVQQNFMFEHDGITQKDAEGAPLWIQFDQINYPQNPNDPFIISAGIMLGSSNSPVNDLLGLAFLLDYDTALVEVGSVSIVYHSLASILGQNNTALEFALDNTLGTVAMANARTNQTYATGFSRIATAYFTITDVVIGRQSQIKFGLQPHSAQGIDTLGNPLPIIGHENAIVFSSTNTQQITQSRTINVYPNPATDYVTLALGNVQANYVDVFDNFGHHIKRVQLAQQNGTIQIPTEDLTVGLYLFQIVTDESTATQRIFIK